MAAGVSRSQRVWFLDELRGLSIFLVILYHAGYDLVYIFGVNIPFFRSSWLDFLQSLFAGLFIFISGCCCQFSRSNLKRGGMALGAGLAMTLFTVVFMPTQAIMFGILHLLGSGMILFAVLRPLLDRIPVQAGAILTALLFALTWKVYLGWLGFFGIPLLRLPQALYSTPWFFALGFPSATFFSSDYFPLMPWLFLFLCGSFLGVPIREGKAPAYFYRLRIPFLAKTGRYTIWIYLLHQPVVFGVLWLFFNITGL